MSKKDRALIDLLKRTLKERIESNPSYSLRAFAASLGIDSSTLSRIFSGKRKLSLDNKKRIVKALKLSEDEVGRFFMSSSNRTDLKTSVNSDLLKKHLDFDFCLVSQVANLDDFEPSVEWVAKRLGLSKERVEARINLLKAYDILTIDDSGKWELLEDNYVALMTDPLVRENRKYVLKQELCRSLDSFDSIDMSEQIRSFAVIPGNKKEIDVLKKKIVKYMEGISQDLKKDDIYDEMYSVSISVYPIRKIAESLE